MKKKVLFISWDGPQTSYMEGLFIPIFSKLVATGNYQIHILQFSWAVNEKTERLRKIAEENNLSYLHEPILRKPNIVAGSAITVIKGKKIVQQYVERNGINIVMPRSIYPGMMVSFNANYKVIYDADGLALEEKIESNSLQRNSLIYKILSGAEFKAVEKSNAVLVRSGNAVDYFSSKIKNIIKDKFFRVTNGRSVTKYSFNEKNRADTRAELGISSDEKLLIYVGSMGQKYGLKQMLSLFKNLTKHTNSFKFLILTPDVEYINNSSDAFEISDVLVKTVKTNDVSAYLSAADYGLCIIHQSLSMSTAAATKLGEYLLAGLPVIATSKIGDVDIFLKNKPFLYFLEDNSAQQLQLAANWILQDKIFERDEIVATGIEFFSVERSAEDYQKALQFVC